tara:strand:- start:175 stop:564 length:390 start_codon:yes stop_codon:yes gene_type:complete
MSYADEFNASKNTSIVLDIGGQYFTTTRYTLESQPGFLSSLSMKNTDCHKLPFIDRDHTHFRYILNFLRGSQVLPKDPLVLQELLVEADFYSLSHLVNSIRSALTGDLQKAECVAVELRRVWCRLQGTY